MTTMNEYNDIIRKNVKRVINETFSQKLDRYLDKVLVFLIEDTKFGFGGHFNESYYILPWDNGYNKMYFYDFKTPTSGTPPHLKGGYFLRREGGRHFENVLSNRFGLNKEECQYVWKVYSKIMVKMLTDFLNKYGSEGNRLNPTPDTSNFSKDYISYISSL